MVYLSDLINKNIYFNSQKYGQMVDFGVLESSPNPSVSKIVVKRNGKKMSISPSVITITNGIGILNSDKVPFLPFDEGAFYLNEDLLDKQVIDTDNKKLVRVNDVILENEGELKVLGIEIGTAAILRRLGIRNFINLTPKIIPWQMIEAFDYNTGNVKISLPENRLNKMHPSELADILEDLGTKERRAIIESLEAGKAAKAIRETDVRTQEAILEELKGNALTQVLAKMHVADIANVFYKLNPLRIKEILSLIGKERADKVEKILDFGTDTAGGMMRTTFWKMDGNLTVKEAYNLLYQHTPKPETVVVTNGNEKLVGTFYTKDLLDSDSLSILKDIVSERKFVNPQVSTKELILLFSRYQLRSIPVVDTDKKPIGMVRIDVILEKIEQGINNEDELI